MPRIVSLTAYVPFIQQLILRIYHRAHRKDNYRSFTYLMDSRGGKRQAEFRAMARHWLQKSESLVALARAKQHYLIEVKYFDDPSPHFAVGMFPIEDSVVTWAAKPGPGPGATLATYFELYRGQLLPVVWTTACHVLNQDIKHQRPWRHFTISLS